VAAHPLPGALVDLVQAGVTADFKPSGPGDLEGGVVGALQGAGVDGVDRTVGEGAGEIAGLHPTEIVQGDVGAALVATVDVPVSLAVAAEDDLRHLTSPSGAGSPGRARSL